MASFISSSALRGARPKKVELKNRHVREELISKLMSQRQVLRFISAPKGFGKSTLCAQYAELVFSFRKVFWIDCASPCFIRDLDSKELASQIIQTCQDPQLVVFDEFTNLDEERSLMFSEIIDNLLLYDCEVIVNGSPYNDSFIKYQNDAYILKAKDLLLNDNEIGDEDKSDIERIPIVAWGGNKSILSLIKCALSEDFTDSVIFSLFLIYLLSETSLDNISTYLSKSDMNLLLDINDEFLYFGIDENKNSFSVPYIFTSELISLFNSEMQTLINVANCTDRCDFAEKLCSLLGKNNKNQSAMELARTIGNKSLRIKILTDLNEDSIRNLYFDTSIKLFDSILINKNNDGLLISFHALHLALMGRISDAVRYSYSVLDNNHSTIDNKIFAALIFLRYGSYGEIDQALKILRFLSNDFKIDNFLNNNKLSKNEKFKCSVINKLIEISFAIHSPAKNPFTVWVNNASEDLSTEDVISAEFILSSINYLNKDNFKDNDFMLFLNKLSRYFNLGTKIDFNFYTYKLIDTYLKHYDELNLLTSSSIWTISDELNLRYLEYKKIYNDKTSSISLEKKYLYSNNNELLNNQNENYEIDQKIILDGIPKLRINVFGGLRAFIGNNEINKSKFGRQNIKLICCILAIENGNEISKDDLAKIIWPDCDEDSRRINMNSHWSVFRKLFTLENGECPYLVRNQNSYKFNGKYFESDLQELERICAEITLGPLDSQAWWEAIDSNENVICGALLPSEMENVYIKNKRIEYRNMIVDALVSAANRLIDAGEIQQSLWFAHKALSRDDEREDVYIALMRAQYEAGQRTPAIETYFACKKFLDEELGIEPSRKISDLYTRVVKETPV